MNKGGSPVDINNLSAGLKVPKVFSRQAAGRKPIAIESNNAPQEDSVVETGETRSDSSDVGVLKKTMARRCGVRVVLCSPLPCFC